MAAWVLMLVVVFAGAHHALADDLSDLLDEPTPPALPGGAVREPVAELEAAVGGGTTFSLVAVDAPERPLAEQLFWRTFRGGVAAETGPVRIRLDGKDLIAPREVQDEKTLAIEREFPVAAQALLADGGHVIEPGTIRFTAQGGRFVSDHPALRFAGDAVRIVCRAVRFEATDDHGVPVPLALRLAAGGLGLLREEANFRVVTVWLPVGLAYTSSLGDFRLDATGRLEPGRLEPGVAATDAGLRLTVPRRPPAAVEPVAAVPPAGGRPMLLADRGRTAFTRDESAVFTVLVPPGHHGGEARLALTGSAMPPVDLGGIELPAVSGPDFDSRLVRIDMRGLPEGQHALALPGADPLPITIVSPHRRSPFLVITDDCPASDAGLDALATAGVEVIAGVPLDGRMPGLDPERLRQLRAGAPTAPAEAAIEPAANDRLLDRLTARRLRSVDLAVTRAAPLYNEGLSYHHSYGPSVGRMIRRLQIFTQQTAGHPSFWGINYAWYPQLFGYAEGGVATDAHVTDRNDALARAVAAAGIAAPSREDLDWYRAHTFASDPADRARAAGILAAAVRHWKAQTDLGFGRHNALYNDAVRAVRPETHFLLRDNAGHDALKRSRALFHDMDAACYRSYTDFGDWPMSTGFTTDWARGTLPGKPVWITAEWSQSAEGAVKSLLHGVARGLAGGGVLLPMDPAAVARRGRSLTFVSQYGAVPTRAEPDGRLAILATDAEQLFDARAPFVYHAVACHLTRLGFPPVIVDDEAVAAGGIPAAVRAVVLARQTHPLAPATAAALDAFVARGGRVLATADSLVRPPVCTPIAAAVKHIHELAGFRPETHARLWDEFADRWRAPLTEALAAAGVEPCAATDPERALALCLDAGPVRYVVVIADSRGRRFGEFQPEEKIPVAVEGTGWLVRDLARQVDLPGREAGGRTHVEVDLVTEPATILALFKAAPSRIVARAAGTAVASAAWPFAAGVETAAGSLGPVPITLSLLDPTGVSRFTAHRAAGDEETFTFPVDAAGTWTLRIQELLTGLSADRPVAVAADRVAPAAALLPDVHVVDERHLRAFLGRRGQKVIVVEPDQPQRMALAESLAKRLAAAGVATRVWQVRPEEFDTLPVRFYPRPEDEAALRLVAAGRLIAERKNLQPFVDPSSGGHLPDRGGYAEIDPPFMVGIDAILFGGGLLAESLRAVTPWMATPHVPGRGQGRLVVVFSPFMADRHVTALVANDDVGFARAADALVAAATPAPAAAAPAARGGLPAATPLTAHRLPVETPLAGFTPVRRVRGVLAAATGRAAVLLDGRHDTVALVDPSGAITATVAAPEAAAHALDDGGRLWLELHDEPAPGRARVRQVRLGTDGRRQVERTVFDEAAGRLGPHGGRGGFAVAPDGRTLAAGRPGGVLLGAAVPETDDRWSFFDDLPHVRKTFEVWAPRFPTAMAFAADSSRLFFTMDTRPPGYENMRQPLERNEGGASFLVDAASGAVVWELRGEPADHACGAGFAAVSAGGRRTAMFDVTNRMAVVDAGGRIVAREIAAPRGASTGPETAPTDGVGAWINPSGSLALFATRSMVTLCDGTGFRRVGLAGAVSAAVIDAGPLAVVGLDDGRVVALRPDGTEAWRIATGGVGPRVAAAADTLLVGTSDGVLVAVDAGGRELRRTDVAAAADRERHEPGAAADFRALPEPVFSREPDTLAVARRRLGAREIAAWRPGGAGRPAHGREFHAVGEPIELAAPPDREAVVHLVYRRPADAAPPAVILRAGADKTEFILDLPTPAWRAVDLPVAAGGVVRVEPRGGLEVAECSMHAIAWPGPNVLFVRPPDAAATVAGDAAAEDLDIELEEDQGAAGAMKETRIWSPNPDIEQRKGPWLPAGSGYDAVNGRRWDMPNWHAGDPFTGQWVTQRNREAVQVSLAATYDVARRQSEVTRRLAVFRNEPSGLRATGGDVLGAAIDNDQFWRLFEFAPVKATVLGCHVHGDGRSQGVGELEFYR